MPNSFDALATSVFKTTTAVMGYDAYWSPSFLPIPVLYARVHFKSPTLKERQILEMERVDFKSDDTIVEYLEPDFPNLEDSANRGGLESLEVEGVMYDVRSVIKKWDGRTYWAICVKK